MDRKAFLALKEEQWVELWPGKGLEVLLVPSEMPDLTTAKLLGVTPEIVKRDLCTNAFIGTRGYTENGKEVPQTLDNRIEFYGFPAARMAIINRLEALNVEVLEGEDDAAND